MSTLGHTLLLVCLWLNAILHRAAAIDDSHEWTNYQTEPKWDMVKINVTTLTKDRSLLAAGYIFIANTRGLQIYDQDGGLVWFEHARNHHRSQDFHPCDYLGEEGTHICFHELRLGGRQNVARGRNVIYNQTYDQVGRNYTKGIEGTPPNLHAFHMLPGGRTFLQPVYVPRKWNLEPYYGLEDGRIWDGCFQEIDVESGDQLFQWCASNHYKPSESKSFFTTNEKVAPAGQTNVTTNKAGFGTPKYPWDPFHINAIDKNEEGDYFVSARHFDQILKIAGPNANRVHGVEPGTALWRLGGKKGDFELVDFSFSKQHAIRHISTSQSETVISILDNAWDGVVEPTHNCSAGRIIKINNSTKQATLLKEYPHPYGRKTESQGDMQVLPNKNALIGWGSLPAVTEYTENGTVVFHAHFETLEYNVHTYRAFKAPWKAYPPWGPKLLAYQSSCDATAPLVAYVSWNGATEVRSWRFHMATHPNGPWIPAGRYTKEGFETRAPLTSADWISPFMPYVSVVALDSSGALIGSAMAETWVPQPKMRRKTCNKWGCSRPDARFVYRPAASRAAYCKRKHRPAYAALIVLVLLVEAVNYTCQGLSALIVAATLRRRGDYETFGSRADLDALADSAPEGGIVLVEKG